MRSRLVALALLSVLVVTTIAGLLFGSDSSSIPDRSNLDELGCQTTVRFDGGVFTTAIAGPGRFSIQVLEASEPLDLVDELGLGIVPICDSFGRPSAATREVEVWSIIGVDPEQAIAAPDVSPANIFVIGSLSTSALLPDSVGRLVE